MRKELGNHYEKRINTANFNRNRKVFHCKYYETCFSAKALKCYFTLNYIVKICEYYYIMKDALIVDFHIRFLLFH